eukprot:g3709.t1
MKKKRKRGTSYNKNENKNAVFNFFNDIKEANIQNGLFNSFTNDIPTTKMHETLLHFFPHESMFESTKFFSLGAQSGSGIDYHYHGDTLFCLLHGIKTWYIYAPGKMPYNVSTRIDLIHENWKYVSFLDPNLTPDDKPTVCVQQKGTTLYLPQLYYHSTENHGEAIGVGWQLDVQRELAINTAVNILKQQPRNALGLHTLLWFTYEQSPMKWIELYKLKPNDLMTAQEALKAICNDKSKNETHIKNREDIIMFWEKKLDFLSHNKKFMNNNERVSIPTLLLSFSQVIHQMFQYRHCLNINTGRIKYLIKLMSIIDINRSMSISKIYFSNESDEIDGTDEFQQLIYESKEEFMRKLEL